MRLGASPILRNVVTIQLAESNRLQPTVYEGRLNAEAFRFAIVASRWNELISARLVEGALDGLKRLGAQEATSVYIVCRALLRFRCWRCDSHSRGSLMRSFVSARSFVDKRRISITSRAKSRVESHMQV